MLSSPIQVEDISNLDLGLRPQEPSKELGQEEFLELMITQLRNQDPFKPLESGEFLGQLAQFGTVEGLAELNSSFSGLADSLVSNQALQASNLVGRNVLVSANAALHEGQGVSGAVEVPANTSAVQVLIEDASGAVVQTLQLGPQSAGLARFDWNGGTEYGPAAQGVYRVRAQAFNGREMQDVSVLTEAAVSSVTFDSRGLAVNLRGLGEVPFTAVREIS